MTRSCAAVCYSHLAQTYLLSAFSRLSGLRGLAPEFRFLVCEAMSAVDAAFGIFAEE